LFRGRAAPPDRQADRSRAPARTVPIKCRAKRLFRTESADAAGNQPASGAVRSCFVHFNRHDCWYFQQILYVPKGGSPALVPGSRGCGHENGARHDRAPRQGWKSIPTGFS